MDSITLDWADIKAQELLPCDGGWDDSLRCVPEGPEEIHRSGCPAKHKFYVAQALREARRIDSWQKIETAPKGVNVLLWWPRWDSTPVIGYYRGDQWSIDNAEYYHDSQPTHWQPLPAPPEADNE